MIQSPCGWIAFAGRMPDDSYRLRLYLERDQSRELLRYRVQYQNCAHGGALFTFVSTPGADVEVVSYDTGCDIRFRIGVGSRGIIHFSETAGAPLVRRMEITTLQPFGANNRHCLPHGWPESL